MQTFAYKGSGYWAPQQLPGEPYPGIGSPRTYYTTGGSIARWGLFGAGIYGVWRIGQIPLESGGKVYDKYIGALRFLEERTPSKIFRTFSLSTLLSPGETLAQAERYIPGEQWSRWLSGRYGPTPMGEYYSRLLNLDVQRSIALAEQGATFSGGRLYLGHGTQGEVLLEHARILRAPLQRRPRIIEEIARANFGLTGDITKGLGLFQELVRNKEGKLVRRFVPSISQVAGEDFFRKEAFAIIGGAGEHDYLKQMARGTASDLVQRFNRLLWGTQETIEKYVPGVKRLLDKLPDEMRSMISLGVERQFVNGRWVDLHATAGRTLGKLFLKWGIAVPLAVGAWQTVDWATRVAGTRGINAYIGTAYMYGKVGLSALAEVTGLHHLREWQEKHAPGSTSLWKLAAFPITGAFYGAVTGYMHKQRVYRSIRKSAEETLGRLSGAARERFAATMDWRIERAVQSALTKKRWQGKAYRWLEDKLANLHMFKEGRLKGFADWVRDTKIGEWALKTPFRKRMLIGAGIGLALIAPFIPGALVPSKRPDQLLEEMRGERDVPIRKGRWWPLGRSAFEGGRIQQWRPSWLALMKARPIETGLWGGPTSPFMKWFLRNFTYTLEKEHYYDRPYAQTGPAFNDVPIFGPLLSATIGKIVKPPMFMHTEEWVTPGGGSVYPAPKPGGVGPPVAGRGFVSGLPPGTIQPAGGIKEVLGAQAHRLQDLVGLPGFIAEVIKGKVTGTKQWFTDYPRLQTAGAMYGGDELRGFWEANLGDPTMLNEFFRRLYPHKERAINRVEPPIRNTMPSWLPGPGSKSPDFLHGDPYVKVPFGEALLPGPGFEALHPELKGVPPEEWPAFWRFYTLARVAPYSDEYKRTVAEVRARIKAGELSEDEVERFNRILEQVRQQKSGEQFYQRKYGHGRASSVQHILEANEKAREGFSPVGSLLGRYWEFIGLHLEQPIEALTPIAPASKFLHMRTAIQAYEREQIYGPKMAMWGTPIESFIKPFFAQVAHEWLGMEGIPAKEQERRRINEYFDILKYVKFTRLKRLAREKGNMAAARRFEDIRRTTMIGVNPLKHDYSHIYRALPSSIRPYFRSFVDTIYDDEKKQLMKIVPEPIKPLLRGQWALRYKDALQKALRRGDLVGMSTSDAKREIERISEAQKTEGFPIDSDLKAEYLATRIKGESYADWYRRKKIAQRLDELGMNLPGPDWVGWGPAELDDIKMKYVLEEGLDMHDFGLWPDRRWMLPYKTYVDEDAVDELQGTLSADEAESRLRDLLRHVDGDVTITMIPAGGYSNSVNLDIRHSAIDDVKRIRQRFDNED